MDAVFAGKLDVIAYLPVDIIRHRICGSKTYDADFLRKHTKYTWHPDPSEEKKTEQIEMFWSVIKGFDDDQKRDFLRFVWARIRLPATL